MNKHEYIGTIADVIAALSDKELRERFIRIGLEYIEMRVEKDNAIARQAKDGAP